MLPLPCVPPFVCCRSLSRVVQDDDTLEGLGQRLTCLDNIHYMHLMRFHDFDKAESVPCSAV